MTNEKTPASHAPTAVPELIPTNTPAHDLGQRFDHAVTTAIHSLPVKERVVAPEHMDGYKIVRHIVAGGEATYHVYDESAWTEPSTTPLLPWSAPAGEIVALVSTKGFVTIL